MHHRSRLLRRELKGGGAWQTMRVITFAREHRFGMVGKQVISCWVVARKTGLVERSTWYSTEVPGHIVKRAGNGGVSATVIAFGAK